METISLFFPQCPLRWMTFVIGLHGAGVSTAISTGMAADTVSIGTVA